MLEHAGSSNMEMDTLQYSYVANVNAGSREAYEQLSAEGIPEIYYLSREELNLSMDSWVDLVCKKKPKAIILGNSITHYWGGDPSCDIKNGSECWEKEMNPRGYLNLGCAWDRIENLLWRVYRISDWE